MAIASIPRVGMTAGEFLSLPEQFDPIHTCQLLEGLVLMNPSPSYWHQVVAANLYDALRAWVGRTGSGRALFAPIDLRLSEDSVLVPDILFYCRGRLPRAGTRHLTEPPDLVIEILSPATRKADLVDKRRIYAQGGVKEYWIVDPDLRAVEILALRGKAYHSLGVSRGKQTLRSPLVGAGEITLEEIFRSP